MDDVKAGEEEVKQSSEEESPPSGGEEYGGYQGGRKPRRRRGKSKKKKWKPYYKLTAQERRDLEENEARRADRVRAERFAHGQPVAPYNTTQFLMEDHDVKEPDLDRVHLNVQRQNSAVKNNESHLEQVQQSQKKRQNNQLTSSQRASAEDFYYSSPDDEGDFLQKEFSEDYKNAHAERLNSMSKGELVQEYLQLEDRVEKLERELTDLRSRMNENSSRCPSRGASFFLPIDSQSSRCSSICSDGESRANPVELRPGSDAIS